MGGIGRTICGSLCLLLVFGWAPQGRKEAAGMEGSRQQVGKEGAVGNMIPFSFVLIIQEMSLHVSYVL